MKNSRFAAKGAIGIKGALLGTLVIWCVFLIFSLVFAAVLFSGDDPTGSTSLFSIIAFVLSGGIGSLINRMLFSRTEKNVPLFSAVLSTIIYLCISAVASARISLGAIISAISFMGAAMIATFKRRKKQKRRYR